MPALIVARALERLMFCRDANARVDDGLFVTVSDDPRELQRSQGRQNLPPQR